VSTAISSLRTILYATTPNNPYRYGAQKLTKGINRIINSQMVPSITESQKQCRTNRFVFFPLQYPYESRLTVFSPEFFDQSFLVEYLSRILPQGVKLFVKQHPNHIGKQSPVWIRRIENNDRVTVLNPSFNAHEAVDHAEGIVVTNNTVGFEALFYNTPLVVLGRSFYQDVPAAVHVTDLSTLPARLADALDQTITDSMVRSSIYSLREATYPGPAPHSDQRSATNIDAFQSFIDSYA
jgi:capsule polysaccharide modification protein KpsS